MAMRFAKKIVVVTALSIICRNPEIPPLTHRSYFNPSNAQFPHPIPPPSLRTSTLPNCGFSSDVHHNQPCIFPRHRWVSSATGFRRIEDTEQEEEEDMSDDCFSEEQSSESSSIEEDPIPNYEEGLLNHVQAVLNNLHRANGFSIEEGKAALDKSGLIPSVNSVRKLLSVLGNDWETAFTIFLWSGAQPRYSHTVSVYHAMISILGKQKKFAIAWRLIKEMQDRSMVTRQTLMIMIRRYAAAQDVHKAIKTFHGMEKFKLSPDLDVFHCLLSSLCRYENVEEAEELIYLNKMYFPLETKTFNIILNGWCNITVDVVQAKRLWRDMYNLCITPDVSSYTTIISCLSKAGNLYDVLRLYDEMKKRGRVPNVKVYNALIYVLAKEKCVKESFSVYKKISEMGFHPNALTYRSLIYPLCKAEKLEDAYIVLDEMIQKGFSPTLRTYHAFLRVIKNGAELFKLLDKMTTAGCVPTRETYNMAIRRFCSLRQCETASKLWNEMENNALSPERSTYNILIRGFFLNGNVYEACKYYEEMKAKGFSPDPETDDMLKVLIAGRKYTSSKLKQKMPNKSSERERRENTSAFHGREPRQAGKGKFDRGSFEFQKQHKKG